MANGFSPLDQLSVASPCPMSWDAMPGGDRVRYCPQCQQNVYNLSGMNRGDAAALVSRREGRLCVRFHQRPDGTVMTDDCPAGLRALRKQVAIWGSMLGVLLVALVGLVVAVFGGRNSRGDDQPPGNRGPLGDFFNWLDPEPPPNIMGGICPPPNPGNQPNPNAPPEQPKQN